MSFQKGIYQDFFSFGYDPLKPDHGLGKLIDDKMQRQNTRTYNESEQQIIDGFTSHAGSKKINSAELKLPWSLKSTSKDDQIVVLIAKLSNKNPGGVDAIIK